MWIRDLITFSIDDETLLIFLNKNVSFLDVSLGSDPFCNVQWLVILYLTFQFTQIPFLHIHLLILIGSLSSHSITLSHSLTGNLAVTTTLSNFALIYWYVKRLPHFIRRLIDALRFGFVLSYSDLTLFLILFCTLTTTFYSRTLLYFLFGSFFLSYPTKRKNFSFHQFRFFFLFLSFILQLLENYDMLRISF